MCERKNILILKELILLMIAVTFAVFVAFNSNIKKPRNDINTYKIYYENVVNTEDLNFAKNNELIGSPNDFLFQSLVYFSHYILRIDDFSFFIFYLSAIIAYIIMHYTAKYSPIPLVGLLFLLADFRFYESFTNALRFGLGMSFLMIAYHKILSYRHSVRNFLFKILPTFAHLSFLQFLIVPKRKLNFIWIFFTLGIILLFLYASFKENMSVILQYLPAFSKDKLIYYFHENMKLEKHNIGIPAYYFLVITVGLFSVYKNKIINQAYIFALNILLVLVLFSIFFLPFGIGYRFSYMMVPFVAILVSFQVDYILQMKNKSKLFKPSIIFVYFIAIAILFSHNATIILMKF